MKPACSQLTLLLTRLVWGAAVTIERLAGLVLRALNQASGHSAARSRSRRRRWRFLLARLAHKEAQQTGRYPMAAVSRSLGR